MGSSGGLPVDAIVGCRQAAAVSLYKYKHRCLTQHPTNYTTTHICPATNIRRFPLSVNLFSSFLEKLLFLPAAVSSTSGPQQVPPAKQHRHRSCLQHACIATYTAHMKSNPLTMMTGIITEVNGLCATIRHM